jgi:NAD(P)H-dependent FMN reductase
METSVENPLFVPVVLGSVRPNRLSYRPALLLGERVATAGLRSELVDLRELNLPIYGQDPAADRLPSVVAFRQVMADADAAIVLTPEYNHGFTSAIKNAIDYLHAEIRRKPVAVCGLSGGGLGGARAVEQLKLVLVEMHALPIRDSVYFSDARSLFDDEGRLLRQEFVGRADDMIAELAWYAETLRWGRSNLPIPARRRG